MAQKLESFDPLPEWVTLILMGFLCLNMGGFLVSVIAFVVMSMP